MSPLPLLLAVAFAAAAPLAPAAPAFTHPGILHSKGDLDRMHEMVQAGVQPWTRGFEALRAVPQSSLDYVLQGPFKDVRYENGQYEFRRDASAAYNLALMWVVTRDARYAAKSLGIIRAWAGAMESFDRGDHLTAGMGTQKFAAAAEIFRYLPDSGWTAADTARFSKFLERLKPALDKPNLFMNQGGYALIGLTSIAVFTDDLPLYRHALHRATVGDHQDPRKDPALAKTILPSGQVIEMGRDQTHPQGGVGSLACIAQTAWIQGKEVAGVDLFAAYDRRLLKGYEYLADHNLGYPGTYEPLDGKGWRDAYQDFSPADRGKLAPIFELVYNHYKYVAKVPAADLRRVSEVRDYLMPEGFSEDFPGFGTLTFTQSAGREKGMGGGPPKPLPAARGGAKDSRRFPAAKFTRAQGVGREYYTDAAGRTELIASNIQSGDYAQYDDFNFGAEPVDAFLASAGSACPNGCKIDILLDGLDGAPIGTLQVQNTGWWSTFAPFVTKLSRPVSGKHRLFLRFYDGKHVFKFQCNLQDFAFGDYAALQKAARATADEPRFPVIAGGRYAAALGGAARRTTGPDALAAAEVSTDGTTLTFLSVEFSQGAGVLAVTVAGAPGGKIEVRCNDPANPPLATFTIPTPADAEAWQTLTADLSPAGPRLKGNQMLFFTFSGLSGSPVKFARFQLDPAGPAPR